MGLRTNFIARDWEDAEQKASEETLFAVKVGWMGLGEIRGAGALRDRSSSNVVCRPRNSLTRGVPEEFRSPEEFPHARSSRGVPVTRGVSRYPRSSPEEFPRGYRL